MQQKKKTIFENNFQHVLKRSKIKIKIIFINFLIKTTKKSISNAKLNCCRLMIHLYMLFLLILVSLITAAYT